MALNRREFLTVATASVVAGFVVSSSVTLAASSKIKAIAFDAFAVFDPRPVFALAEQAIGPNLTDLISFVKTAS